MEDRRIRRTKKLLKEALLELMGEKEFKNITVKDITERADLNRGTFYLHYTDTYDLLQKIEQEFICEFERMIDNYKPDSTKKYSHEFLNQLFDFVSENLELCRNMFQHNPNNGYLDQLIQIIISKGFKFNKDLSLGENTSLEVYQFYFLAHGVIGILAKWFENGRNVPKDSIIEMIERFLSVTLAPEWT